MAEKNAERYTATAALPKAVREKLEKRAADQAAEKRSK
jgi:hypothetical protein